MKKISLWLFALINLSLTQAQVYVNVPNTEDQEASASFQVETQNAKKGVALPSVALTSIDSYQPIVMEPKPGLLVYNTTVDESLDAGYYYWDLTPNPHWERMGGTVDKYTILQNIDEDILGYSPTGTGATATPSIPAVGNTSYDKASCVKWELSDGGNGHSYCTYNYSDAANGKDFQTFFNAAKTANGYLLTVTSTAEWNFVKNNVLNNVSSPVWLGYVAMKTPGNDYKYRWITNETWRNNWSNNASTQSAFANGQPQPAYPGRCTVISSNTNANREWFTNDCDQPKYGNIAINKLIIEFNQ